MGLFFALVNVAVSFFSWIFSLIIGIIISSVLFVSAAFSATTAEYGDDYTTITINDTISFTLCNEEWKDYVTWEINLGGHVDQWNEEENISVRSFAENGLLGDYQMVFDRGHYHNGKVYGTFTREEFISLLSWLNNSASINTNIALYGDFHREHVYVSGIQDSRRVFNEVVSIVHNYRNFDLF